MTAPEDALLAAAAEYQKAAADLREVIREGREVIQDSDTARRELTDEVKNARAVGARLVDELVRPAIEDAIGSLRRELEEQAGRWRAYVESGFKEVSALLMGRVSEAARRVAATPGATDRPPTVVGNVPLAFVASPDTDLASARRDARRASDRDQRAARRASRRTT